MYIKKEMNFQDLLNNSWSGATETLRKIELADKEDELMVYLEEMFGDQDAPDETSVNDYLWFESEDIFDNLGLNENGELEEEEEE